MNSRILLPLTALVLVAALSWWIHAASHPDGRRDAPRSESAAAIFANGRIEGAAPPAALHAWDTGRVVEILVRSGQQVAANQLLMRLDDEQHRLAVALAEAELSRARGELERLINGARDLEVREAEGILAAKRAALQRAQVTWSRTQKLRADGVVAQQLADDDQAAVAQLAAEVAAAQARAELLAAPARADERRIAEARVAAAQAKVQQAALLLQRRELRAPFAGQVLQINVEPGEMTLPQAAEAPLILADTTRLRVRAFVEELEAPLVGVGMPAEIRADGIEQPFRGQVSHVSPHMSGKSLWSNTPGERHDTKTREIWIDLEEPRHLIVGLRVDVLLHPRPSNARQPQQKRE